MGAAARQWPAVGPDFGVKADGGRKFYILTPTLMGGGEGSERSPAFCGWGEAWDAARCVTMGLGRDGVDKVQLWELDLGMKVDGDFD